MTDRGPALAVRDLEVVYQRGGDPAASGVTLELPRGEGLLLAGGHGAGKTSVLRALLGLTPFTGEVSVLGGRPGDPGVLRRVGYGPQGRAFTEGSSPRALVGLVASIRLGTPAGDAANEALVRAGIPERRRGSRSLDVEEARRVSLACAIAGDPELLVLDDPWEFPETAAEIARARRREGAVIVATHDPGGLPRLLDRAITLVDGVPG